MVSRLSVSCLALALSLPQMATAQESPEQSDPSPERGPDGEILVVAERIRGQVQTDLPPVLELNEEEIAAYGAGSLTDLMAQLAPQTSSGSGRGSGRPIFLVNGRRVSGFREMRRYPPEAIRKVEVLPEEVALQYGYAATQRVVNFILKDNFASREIEVEYGEPTQGGRGQGQLESSILTINGPDRLLLGVEFNTASMLTEDERGIVQAEGSNPTLASDPDPARFRSLAPDSESFEAEATYNTSLGGDRPGAGAFSLNANLARSHTINFSGLDSVLLTGPEGTALRTLDADPLARLTRVTSASLGSTFNQPLGDWQLDLTADANRTLTDSFIDKRRDTSALQAQAAAGTLNILGPLPSVADAGQDEARSRTWTLDSLATLRGSLFAMPAGEASLTLNSGYRWNRIESEDTRSTSGPIDLSRGRVKGGFNLGLPLTSAREGVLGAVGDWTLNVSGGVDHLSDFGTLTDWSTGLTWRTGFGLSLSGSYRARKEAPSLSQLGAPQTESYNVPVYDLTNDETVLVTVLSGGNPALLRETQRDWKLGAYYDLDLFSRANLSVEYFHNASDNVASDFPLLTPAIEGAFADRVERDANNRLTLIDRRPVTFAEQRSSRIRYGFNVSGRVGKAPPRGEGRGRGVGGPPDGAAPQGEGRRGSFDPAQMEAARTTLCSGDPASVPDLATLPDFIAARLRNEDGSVNMEAVTRARARFCAADGATGQAGGDGPQARFDPARFEAIRKTLCAAPKDGEAPDLSGLPERMLQRLRGEDGAIDPAKLAELRSRICASGEGTNPPARASSGGGGGRGGGMGMFGRRDGQGRWSLSLYHSVELTNTALIAPGVPALDLLDGASLGSGANARHRVELEGGIFYRGIGMRLSGNYTGKGRIDGTGLPGSTTLYYGDIATFNLRTFIDLERQSWLTGESPGFFKGSRLAIRVNNLFDAQRRITDGTGTVPLAFQPGLFDPIGRYIEIDFRKVF